MADSKISSLSALAETPNDSDLLTVVDVSDTSMAGSGTNKKITVANALSGKADASHTQAASTITDFDTEVSNNTDVAANTSARHTRSHTVTSTSDHTAGNHKTFYSNGSGEVVELTHGSAGKVLTTNGATSAPTWETPAGGSSDAEDVTYDPTGSGMTATDVQAAIDELKGDIVGGGGGDASTNTSSSVDSEVALFSGTGGKTLKRATGSGMAKLTSGVLGTGTAGTDYTTPSSTEAFTNKTFDADGTGNSITNIEVADLKTGVLDTDLSTVAGTDTTIPSAKATKTALDLKAPLASPTFTGTVTLPTGLTGVVRADSGVVSVDTDVTDIVAAATDIAAGKVELATTAEATTGTDTTRAVTAAGVKAVGDTKQPLDSDLTTIAGLTATTDNFIQSKSSAWASRTPTQVTADLIAMVGDSGSGGTKGLVPAPGTGDAAASKFLKADGTWATASGSGSVATDTIFDAKGDIAVGTGSDTSQKRTVGANGTVLTADSAETTGVKWATPSGGTPAPRFTFGSYFETAGRFTASTGGSGTNTFGGSGVTWVTSSTNSSFAGVRTGPFYSGTYSLFGGNYQFTSVSVLGTGTPNGNFIQPHGVGFALMCNAAGITQTSKHVGWLNHYTGGAWSHKYSVADGSTQNTGTFSMTFDAALVYTIVVTGTTSAAFYKEGSLLGTLTANIPTGSETVVAFSSSNMNSNTSGQTGSTALFEYSKEI